MKRTMLLVSPQHRIAMWIRETGIKGPDLDTVRPSPLTYDQMSTYGVQASELHG